MELRVLRYFLMAAREENITKAAKLLHITQPTLSRQLMQLEEELGVKLFHRGKYHIVLTEEGMLLRRRAQEMIELEEKTKREFSKEEAELAGEIAIGCGETRNMTFLSQKMAQFRQEHPLIRYDVYSAIADDIKERMEKGILDLALLMEPVDIAKYEFVRMPEKEQWGVLVREDSPLASLEAVSPEDLIGQPILNAKREIVQNELANWFGDAYDKIEIAATYNLILNASNMVRNGVGAALCFRLDNQYDGLRFVPLEPELETGAVLAWKKNQTFSETSSRFIDFIKHSF